MIVCIARSIESVALTSGGEGMLGYLVMNDGYESDDLSKPTISNHFTSFKAAVAPCMWLVHVCVCV